MVQVKISVLAAVFLTMLGCSSPARTNSISNRAFVLFDTQTNHFTYIEKSNADKPHSPCSTYKIPHAIFGLEVGYLTDKDFLQKYDTKKNPEKKFWPKSWAKDHTLESAIQNSVVWYFQEVARRIGPQRMQNYLDRIDYGNKDISGGIDQFWLGSSLLISPRQQVQVLSRLLGSNTAFSKKHVATVKQIILWDKTHKHPIHAKTGTCRQPNGNYGAWLVGYVNSNSVPKYFASYLEDKDYQAISAERKRFTIESLKKFGVL